jgi:hypothetical protein
MHLTIPVVLLIIPFHLRRMPTLDRMDSSPPAAGKRLHEAEKTRLRGMLEAFDSG